MTNERDTFPILDEDLLLSLSKANKAQDLERMYTSPNSEDWVTWNMLRALQRTPGDGWWQGVVQAAEADAGHSGRWSFLGATPTVELWRTVPSPPAYEAASRQRMSSSTNMDWLARAESSRAVEGVTEVDLVFDGEDYLVFVEAKLHSDISTGTTFDPDRNQIIRNIDCLIEQANGREPFFWMFVDDRYPTRQYMDLIEIYRSDLTEVHRALPHRDPVTLRAIVDTIAIVTWGDLLPLVEETAEVAAVTRELARRIGAHTDRVVDPPAGAKSHLRRILPIADWDAVDPALTLHDTITAAVATIELDGIARHPLGSVVHGVGELGAISIDRENAPTLIRWRLLPMLPETWGEIAQTTIGEMLNLDGIGEGKIRCLIEYAANRTLRTQQIPSEPTDVPQSPGDVAVLDAFRKIAAWGYTVGHRTMTVALADALAGRGSGPDEAIRRLDQIDLESFGGKEFIKANDPVLVAQRILDEFDGRDHEILERRVLVLDPKERSTLDAIGNKYSISRERVRQVEQSVTSRLRALASLPENRPIQSAIHDIRLTVGTACPLDAAPTILHQDDSSLVEEFLAWIAGPYILSDGWLLRGIDSPIALARAALDSVAVNGIADRSAVIDELLVRGVHADHAARLLDEGGQFSSHGDLIFLRPRTMAGRAVLQLRLHGRPMTYGELFELDDDAESMQSFRNSIANAVELQLVGNGVVGLTEWEGEEYPGVVQAMVDAIVASGGSAQLAALASDLHDRFNIAEASVSIHATMNPLFVTSNGQVRVRTYAEPYVPETDLTASRDCFFIDGRWSLRLPVDRDMLRGSGRMVPEAFAVHFGLQPFQTTEIEGPVRHVHARWGQGPAIGSIRLNVLDQGLDEGDFVFVRYARDRSFEFVGIPRTELAMAEPARRLMMLAGNPNPGDTWSWSEALATALGMPTTGPIDTGTLRSCLIARRQHDLLELLDHLDGH